MKRAHIFTDFHNTRAKSVAKTFELWYHYRSTKPKEKNKMLFAAITAQQIVLIVICVLLMVAILVLPMFTNKKRQKAVQEMHKSISVGDTVKTVGGIVGKIAEIHNVSDTEKEFVLSTGIEGNKSLLTFDFNAIYQVMSKAAPVVSKKEAAPVEETPAEAAPAEEAPAEVAAEEKTENK